MMWVWCARIAWAALPVTAGSAFVDAIDGWSTAPARVAALALWTAWAAGLLALFAPRPWGLTLVRIVAPIGVLCAIATLPSTSGPRAALAIASTLVAAVTSLAPAIAIACGNALAYGDEQRFPLRIPTPLLFGPLPLGTLLVASGAVVGPLLVADQRYLVGALVTGIGWVIAVVAIRAVHALSQRWLVLVPAGIAIVDAMTLIDPVLVRREQISALQRVTTTAAEGTLDLRLGTLNGGVAIALSETVAVGRRRGRTAVERVEPRAIIVAAHDARRLVSLAHARRIPTR